MRNIIFYLVLIIAAIGLVMNLDAFIFSIEFRENVNQLCCNSWYYLSDLLFLHLN